MSTNWPEKMRSMVNSKIGAGAQATRERSVRERPELGAPSDNFENNALAGGRLLPVPDIVRALRRYSDDPDVCEVKRRVPLAAVASLCGLSRQTIYQARRGGMSDATRVILSRVVAWIETGEIRFRRRGQVWQPEYRRRPDRLPPPQDRLVRAEDFVEWSTVLPNVRRTALSRRSS